jgi:hypothetical protein
MVFSTWLGRLPQRALECIFRHAQLWASKSTYSRKILPRTCGDLVRWNARQRALKIIDDGPRFNDAAMSGTLADCATEIVVGRDSLSA